MCCLQNIIAMCATCGVTRYVTPMRRCNSNKSIIVTSVMFASLVAMGLIQNIVTRVGTACPWRDSNHTNVDQSRQMRFVASVWKDSKLLDTLRKQHAVTSFTKTAWKDTYNMMPDAQSANARCSRIYRVYGAWWMNFEMKNWYPKNTWIGVSDICAMIVTPCPKVILVLLETNAIHVVVTTHLRTQSSRGMMDMRKRKRKNIETNPTYPALLVCHFFVKGHHTHRVSKMMDLFPWNSIQKI